MKEKLEYVMRGLDELHSVLHGVQESGRLDESLQGDIEWATFRANYYAAELRRLLMEEV